MRDNRDLADKLWNAALTLAGWFVANYILSQHGFSGWDTFWLLIGAELFVTRWQMTWWRK